jgi:hypothetical protein
VALFPFLAIPLMLGLLGRGELRMAYRLPLRLVLRFVGDDNVAG